MCSEASHLVQVFLIRLGLFNTHVGDRLYHTEYAVLCPVLSYLLQLLWSGRSQKETFPGHSWVNRIAFNYSLRVWSPDKMLTPATRAVLFMIPFHICCLCVHLFWYLHVYSKKTYRWICRHIKSLIFTVKLPTLEIKDGQPNNLPYL